MFRKFFNWLDELCLPPEQFSVPLEPPKQEKVKSSPQTWRESDMDDELVIDRIGYTWQKQIHLRRLGSGKTRAGHRRTLCGTSIFSSDRPIALVLEEGPDLLKGVCPNCRSKLTQLISDAASGGKVVRLSRVDERSELDERMRY